MTLTLQYGVIALLVCASVLTVLSKTMPKQAARLRLKLAAHLTQPGRSAVWRKLGSKLAQSSQGGGCDSGCSTCGSCDSATAAPGDTQPLTFVRPRK